MKKINSAIALREAILQLEIRHAEEGRLLKKQFHLVYESVKPINLIKSTFKEAIASSTVKENILNTSVGLVSGYLSKLLFVNVSHNPLRKFLGFALQFGITDVVAIYPHMIKSIGSLVLNRVKRKFGPSPNGTGHHTNL